MSVASVELVHEFYDASGGRHSFVVLGGADPGSRAVTAPKSVYRGRHRRRPGPWIRLRWPQVGRTAPGLTWHHGLNGLLQTLLQRDRRGEFQHFARLSRVTHRHPQITSALRRMPRGKGGTLHLPNYLAELANLGFYTGADVIDLWSKGSGIYG